MKDISRLLFFPFEMLLGTIYHQFKWNQLIMSLEIQKQKQVGL